MLRGILIGLLFGIPVEAVGALTVQRTWGMSHFGFSASLARHYYSLGWSIDFSYGIPLQQPF